MKFTEEKLEKAFTELLGQEGFPLVLAHLQNVSGIVKQSNRFLFKDAFLSVF